MESSFVLKIRTEDHTAVSIIAGPVLNPYEPLTDALMALDDEHAAVIVGSNVVADLLRRMEMASV